jgi:hypothetical protein
MGTEQEQDKNIVNIQVLMQTKTEKNATTKNGMFENRFF